MEPFGEKYGQYTRDAAGNMPAYFAKKSREISRNIIFYI
jgi:hypothetical protein